ncbi:hypothetical protein ES703_118428 [subsurface metagenome]
MVEFRLNLTIGLIIAVNGFLNLVSGSYGWLNSHLGSSCQLLNYQDIICLCHGYL